METINANNTMRQNNLGPRNPNIGQRTTPTSRQQRKPKGGSRYDIT